MTIPDWLSLFALILQLLGAAWLVYCSFATEKKLRLHGAVATYDNIGNLVSDLAVELAGQFRQQLRGFAFLVAGSALQVWVLLCA